MPSSFRWSAAVDEWRDHNAHQVIALPEGSAPSANDEYILYQTLVGSWPLTGDVYHELV